MEREYQILVNGRHHKLLSAETMVPYEDIILIAHGKIRRFDYTVTWYYPVDKRGGTLTAGESVRLRDGLIFSVADTTGA